MVSVVVLVIMYVGQWKYYAKMGRESWEGIIPLYNTYVLFSELYGNGWKFLLLLIPVYNIYVAIKANIDLAHRFQQKTAFGVGLTLLPVVFSPLLGFGKYVYQGASVSTGEKDDEEEKHEGFTLDGVSFKVADNSVNENNTAAKEPDKNPPLPAQPLAQENDPQEKQCPHCGYAVDGSMKTCPNCGLPLHTFDKPTYCTKCGTEIPAGESVCPKCKEAEEKADTQKSQLDSEQTSQSSGGQPEPEKKTKQNKIILLIVGIVVAILLICSETMRLFACLAGIILFFVSLVLWIVCHASQKPKKKWGILMLVAVVLVFVYIIAPSACTHEWVEATCTEPKTCSKCGETEGDALGHEEGDWENSGTDIVHATVTYKKYCVVCGDELDTKTSPLTKLYDGEMFLFSPKEFTERLGDMLDTAAGNNISVEYTSIDGDAACGVYSDDERVGAFFFLDNGEWVSSGDANEPCFNTLFGAIDLEYGEAIARVMLALAMTCDPTLDFSKAKEIASSVCDGSAEIQNSILYAIGEYGDKAAIRVGVDS